MKRHRHTENVFLHRCTFFWLPTVKLHTVKSAAFIRIPRELNRQVSIFPDMKYSFSSSIISVLYRPINKTSSVSS